MEKFYCKYCGTFRSSIQNLTSGNCPRHPDGPYKGRHVLYQGYEKKQYTCEFCGTIRSSITNLTAGNCPRHPNGPNKGKHCPAR